MEKTERKNMQQDLPHIDVALIKVTGVFTFSKKNIRIFTQAGYNTIPISDNISDLNLSQKDEIVQSAKKWYKDNYYHEFASLMFTGEAENKPMKPLLRDQSFNLTLYLGKNNERIINSICVNQELFLFNNEVGIFALTFEPESLNFNSISDLTVALKSFDSNLTYNQTEYKFHEFISKQVLAGIPLRGDNVQADAYSGSKFKIYTIISTPDLDDGKKYNRDKLVYEIGTGSRIGEMGLNGYNSPSAEYFDELMKNSIKVFNNYTGLALLDSFTVIGTKVFSSRQENFISFNTYNRVYFAIYILNLYIRYNIFRFNAVFNENPVKTREEFEEFINEYNFSHISFNFLPNIFHQKIHDAQNIDEEIKHFEKRLGSLATKIQENQEKRQATLLGLVSLLTGLSSFTDIIDLFETTRVGLALSSTLFYSLLGLMIVIIAIPVLAFLFPENFKKVKKKITKKKKAN